VVGDPCGVGLQHGLPLEEWPSKSRHYDDLDQGRETMIASPSIAPQGEIEDVPEPITPANG